MPTLFIIFGLRFFFYADEHLPIHVHVENADGRAKFLVHPNVEIVSKRDETFVFETGKGNYHRTAS